MRSSVPIVPKSEAKYLSFDVTTGTQRDADASETTLFNPRSVSSAAIAGQPCTLSRSARGPGVLAPTQIEVRCQGAEPVICRAEACDNSYGPLWVVDKKVDRKSTRLNSSH